MPSSPTETKQSMILHYKFKDSKKQEVSKIYQQKDGNWCILSQDINKEIPSKILEEKEHNIKTEG